MLRPFAAAPGHNMQAPLSCALGVSGLKLVPSWLTVTDIRLDKPQVGIAPSREFY